MPTARKPHTRRTKNRCTRLMEKFSKLHGQSTMEQRKTEFPSCTHRSGARISQILPMQYSYNLSILFTKPANRRSANFLWFSELRLLFFISLPMLGACGDLDLTSKYLEVKIYNSYEEPSYAGDSHSCNASWYEPLSVTFSLTGVFLTLEDPESG